MSTSTGRPSLDASPSKLNLLPTPTFIDKGWSEFTFKRRRGNPSKKSYYIRVPHTGEGSAEDMAHKVNKSISKLMSSTDDTEGGQPMAKRPSLLISVTGSAAAPIEFRENVRTRFTNELMGVASSTDAWVFTGGTEAGVMQVMGNMQRDWGHPTPCCLAIAPWGCLANRSVFEKAGDGEIPDYDNRYKITEQFGGVYLDPNHTHYVLFDNGKTIEKDKYAAFGGESLFSNALEAAVTKDGTQVPGIQLVYGGGAFTVDTMLGAVKKHIPILIVSNSGRIADIIHAKVQGKQEKFERLLAKECWTDDVHNEKCQKVIDKIDTLLSEGQVSFYDVLGEEENLSQIIIDALVKGPLTKAVKLTTLANWTTLNSSGDSRDDFTERAFKTLHKVLTDGIYLTGVDEKNYLTMTHELKKDEELDEELLVHAAYHNKGTLFRDLIECGYKPALLDELIRHELGCADAAARAVIKWEQLYKGRYPDEQKEVVFRITNLHLKNYKSELEFYKSNSEEEREAMKGFIDREQLQAGNGFFGCVIMAKKRSNEVQLWQRAKIEEVHMRSKEYTLRFPDLNGNLVRERVAFDDVEPRELTYFDRIYWAFVVSLPAHSFSVRFLTVLIEQTDRLDIVAPMCEKSDFSMTAALAALRINNRLADCCRKMGRACPELKTHAEELDLYATRTLDGILDPDDALLALTIDLNDEAEGTADGGRTSKSGNGRIMNDEEALKSPIARSRTVRDDSGSIEEQELPKTQYQVTRERQFLMPDHDLGDKGQICVFESRDNTRIDFAIRADARGFLNHHHVRTYLDQTKDHERQPFVVWNFWFYLFFLLAFAAYNVVHWNVQGKLRGKKVQESEVHPDDFLFYGPYVLGFIYVYGWCYLWDEWEQLERRASLRRYLNETEWDPYVLAFFALSEMVRSQLVLPHTKYLVALVCRMFDYEMEELHVLSGEGRIEELHVLLTALCLFFGVWRVMEHLSANGSRDGSGFSIIFITTMRILRNDLGGFAMLLSLVMCSFLPIVWFFKTDLRGMIGSSVVKLLLYPVLGEMGDGEAHEDNTSNNQGATLFFVGYFFLVGIVLANLLICMINNRYDDIIDDADRQYITKRMMSIRDRFSSFRCLPPPFNLGASITGALRRNSMHQCRDEREQHFMFNLLSLTVFLTTAVALVQAVVIMSPCLQDLLLQWLKNICQQSGWFSQVTGCAILVLAGYVVLQWKSVAGACGFKVLDPWRLFRGDLAVATVVFLALAIPLGHIIDSDGTVPSVSQGMVIGLSQYHNMTWLILGLVGVGYYNVQDPAHSEIANAKEKKCSNSDKMASILKKAKGIASLTSERDKVLAQKQHADTEKLMEHLQKLQEQV
jgi:hypothetical protein